LSIEADVLVDGHDHLCAEILARGPDDRAWRRFPMDAQVNDCFSASFALDKLGRWQYTVEAWIDLFGTWLWALGRKVGAGRDVAVELVDGARLIEQAAGRATGQDATWLRQRALALAQAGEQADRVALAKDAELLARMRRYPDREHATVFEPALEVVVDPPWARFSAWYELFPRSWGEAGHHGTLRDVESRLDYVAGMGFDILYLPPIHPIGRSYRKGRNNSLTCEPNEPGSPWAIGGEEGGHEAIHPELGTVEDFERLVAKAKSLGIKIAIDIAFQASPDHPYVSRHPDWFIHRSDGSIQYAENPPKQYQDVYPFDFTGPDWQSLWEELRGVFATWIERGVHVFRVDNPHTKPIPFWQWCIGSLKAEHPDVIFLAEAFTRPKLMLALAKAGFSQSYTYFTWRTTKSDLQSYMREIIDSGAVEFFRPNFWPNTPDILPEHLQFGGRAMFITRAVLAATLSPSWGIYGPAFELMANQARPGSEEYLDSEKYQLYAWNLESSDSLAPVIRRLNHIRRGSPSLHGLAGLTFHETDNPYVMCYSKRSPTDDDVTLTVVNLDPVNRHGAWIDLDYRALGAERGSPLQTHDLISDARFLWQGQRAFVELDPSIMPAHVFRVHRRVLREQSFEYFL
jgi:starch synthase (maltosyl-transferring)